MAKRWLILAFLILSVAKSLLPVTSVKISENWVAWKAKYSIILHLNAVILKEVQRIGKLRTQSLQFILIYIFWIVIKLYQRFNFVFSINFSVNAGTNVIRYSPRTVQKHAGVTVLAQLLVKMKVLIVKHYKRNYIHLTWRTNI